MHLEGEGSVRLVFATLMSKKDGGAANGDDTARTEIHVWNTTITKARMIIFEFHT